MEFLNELLLLLSSNLDALALIAVGLILALAAKLGKNVPLILSLVEKGKEHKEELAKALSKLIKPLLEKEEKVEEKKEDKE